MGAATIVAPEAPKYHEELYVSPKNLVGKRKSVARRKLA